MFTINATFIIVFVSFIIFILLMKYICYLPLMKVMSEREKFYAKNKETIQKTDGKKQDILNEINAELKDAKLEGSKLLADVQEKIKCEKENALLTKKNELNEEARDFSNMLEENSKNIKEEIKNECEIYVKKTVAKVLNINEDEIKVNVSKISEMIK